MLGKPAAAAAARMLPGATSRSCSLQSSGAGRWRARVFRHAEMYLEHLMERPRHVEFQVLGRPARRRPHLHEQRLLHAAAQSEVIEEATAPGVARGEAGAMAARLAGTCARWVTTTSAPGNADGRRPRRVQLLELKHAPAGGARRDRGSDGGRPGQAQIRSAAGESSRISCLPGSIVRPRDRSPRLRGGSEEFLPLAGPAQDYFVRPEERGSAWKPGSPKAGRSRRITIR